MEPVNAFFNGLKPAFYENRSELDSPTISKLEEYPYIDVDNDLTIFFQTKPQMFIFKEKTNRLVKDTPHFDKILGLSLGFPPKAVEFYIKSRYDDHTINFFNEMGLHYCGVSCASSINDIKENAFWLWDTYNHWSTLEISVLREDKTGKFVEMLEVSYKDKHKLEEIQNELTEKEAVYT